MSGLAVLDRPHARGPRGRDVVELRSPGGRLAAAPGAQILLLSRLSQTSPLRYVPDEQDPDLVPVLASSPGSDRDVVLRPDDLAVEIGRATGRARGRVLVEHGRRARDDRWSRVDQLLARHQRTSRRAAPVVTPTLQQES